MRAFVARRLLQLSQLGLLVRGISRRFHCREWPVSKKGRFVRSEHWRSSASQLPSTGVALLSITYRPYCRWRACSCWALKWVAECVVKITLEQGPTAHRRQTPRRFSATGSTRARPRPIGTIHQSAHCRYLLSICATEAARAHPPTALRGLGASSKGPLSLWRSIRVWRREWRPRVHRTISKTRMRHAHLSRRTRMARTVQ